MIARELHDELGQSVTAVRSMALSIAARMHSLDPQAESAARLIAEESSRLYDAMHGIIPRLTPLVLDNFGLAEALNDLAERTQRSHAELRIDMDVELNDVVLMSDAALALYRAAQEGLTNALRHGHAKVVQITVQGHADEVTLELVDDGRGLPPEGVKRTGHYGLLWLEERVKALGGAFDISGASPNGVRLRVRVPLHMPSATAMEPA
jgi:two-component system sensor histidine kinase UhpB